MSKFGFVEYLWIDGAQPTQGIRSKARVVSLPENPKIEDFPAWSFDGSSTGQAAGNDSDCILQPVRVYNDPLRGEGNYLVLCEVDDPSGGPHASNQRARLRAALEGCTVTADRSAFRKTASPHRRDPTTAAPAPRKYTGARSSRSMPGPASRPVY
jgi:glutamine synthetase